MDDADGMEEGKEVIRPAIVFSSQALDGITFAMAVGVWGIAGEANPVVSLIYGATGLPGVLSIKFAVAIIATMLVRRIGGRWWLFPALIGVFGAASNAVALL